jgi:hypothetical protein
VNLATIALIAGTAWISLLIVAVAICRASAHADAVSERFYAATH